MIRGSRGTDSWEPCNGPTLRTRVEKRCLLAKPFKGLFGLPAAAAHGTAQYSVFLHQPVGAPLELDAILPGRRTRSIIETLPERPHLLFEPLVLGQQLLEFGSDVDQRLFQRWVAEITR